ncbi:hypothetical protein QUW63_01250 [Pseudoflavonifractor phocaeensis]|uniref:hypothetical protein n=1 Tax=Pseudoflavonifractor phocaeensis TaxID=1870988 RepID=UPI0025A48C47|nr:hypothetical protein [Pseudoflavonifractor phocaeensis]MDM8237732.1 hypothetical protein [Pseudoflavonifractor phocaeensis]
MPDKKFSIYDASNGDLNPLFTTKLQETACVGCLRGVFTGREIGDGVTVTWMRQNRDLESPGFLTELNELLDELRNNGTLNSFPAMEAYCKAHPEHECLIDRPSTHPAWTAANIDTTFGFSRKCRNSTSSVIEQTGCGQSAPGQISMRYMAAKRKKGIGGMIAHESISGRTAKALPCAGD